LYYETHISLEKLGNAMLRRLLNIVTLAFIAALLLGAGASAQPSTPLPTSKEVETAIFTSPPPPGDIVQQWIAKLFNIQASSGPVAPGQAVKGDFSGEGFVGSIPKIIGIFNVVCGVFAAIAMFYYGALYAVDVGRDGRLDGHGVDAVWSPLRTMMGVALLLPLPGGVGWSAAQYATGYIAYYGIAGANYVWQKSADFAFQSNEPLTPVPSLTTTNFVGDVLRSNVCARYFNQRADDAGMRGTESPFQSVRQNKNGIHIIAYEPVAENARRSLGQTSDFTCGSVRIAGAGAVNSSAAPKNLNPGILDAAWWRQKVFGEKTAAKSGGLSNEDYTSYQAHFRAFDALDKAANKASVEIANLMRVEVSSKDKEAEIKRLVADFVDTNVKTYEKQLMDEALLLARPSGDSSTTHERIKMAGWTNAGAFYMAYAVQASSVASIVSKLPQYDEPNVSARTTGTTGAQAQRKLAVFNDILNGAINDATNVKMTNGTTSTGLVGVIRNATDVGYQDGNLSTAPLKTMVNMGHTYMMIGTTLMVVDVAVKSSGLGSLFKGNNNNNGNGTGGLKLPGLAGLATYLGGGILSAIGWLGPFFVFLGAFMAYAMPLFPAIMWYAGVMGFLLLFFEALIASSLWAISHIRPGDKGMIGSAQHGYAINLALLIRPMLMTLGMITGITIYSVIAGAASNGIWGFAAPALGADSTIGAPIGVVVVMIVVVTFQISLAYASFNAIFTISDNVPKWLGIDAGGHHNPAQSISQMQGLMTVGGMQQATGALSQTMSAGANAAAKSRADKLAEPENEAKRLAGKEAEGQIFAKHVAAAISPKPPGGGGGGAGKPDPKNGQATQTAADATQALPNKALPE
jgi:conjugal transfer/type IV secretion protein DotA/TraY